MRRRVLSVVLAAAAGAALAAVTPSVAQAADQPYRLGSDGTTSAIYSYPGAIRETAWVDIGLDQDQDGVDDRVAADIIRPAEPAKLGQRIPTIMDVSGYYYNIGRGNEGQTKKLVDGKPVSFPLFLDNYFVPRGYAIVLVDLAGTGRSTGCTDFGGPSEVASSTRVVDWLNGRVPGYTSRYGSKQETATWSSGSVGQIGKSWDGQNVYESAASGVEGLKAAVPEAGIASTYTSYKNDTGSSIYLPTTADYTQYFGLENKHSRTNQHCQDLLQKVRDGEPKNNNYTAEWAKRNFTRTANKVTAAMLVEQGQDDANVQPLNFGTFWSLLPASTPKKLWLSLTGHVDPFDYRRFEWVDTLHRWFDRFLYDIPNGIDQQPQLTVERAPNQWSDLPSFPAAGTADTTVYAAPSTGSRQGVLQGTPGPDTSTTIGPYRKGNLQTGALTSDLRLSGTPSISVGVTPTTDGNETVGVELVDYGPATTRGGPGNDSGIKDPRTIQNCLGGSTPQDTGCFYRTPAVVKQVQKQVIAIGQADLRHADSIEHVNAVNAGQRYTVTIPLWTMDRIVPAGHRIGVLIVPFGDPVGLDYAQTRLTLPAVDGAVPLPTTATPSTQSEPAPVSRTLSPLG